MFKKHLFIAILILVVAALVAGCAAPAAPAPRAAQPTAAPAAAEPTKAPEAPAAKPVEGKFKMGLLTARQRQRPGLEHHGVQRAEAGREGPGRGGCHTSS